MTLATGGRRRCFSVDAGPLQFQSTALWRSNKIEDALKSLPSFPIPSIELQDVRGDCRPVHSPPSTPALNRLDSDIHLQPTPRPGYGPPRPSDPRRNPSFASQAHRMSTQYVPDNPRQKRGSHMWAVAIDMQLPAPSESCSTSTAPPPLGEDFHAPNWVPQRARASFVLAFYTVPREAYWTILLRIPPLYHSLVQRLLRDVNMGRDDIEAMVMEAMEMEREDSNVVGKAGIGTNMGVGMGNWTGLSESDKKMFMLEQGMLSQEWVGTKNAGMPPPLAYINLRDSWKTFLDSLIREWKTLNMISVLLLSAVLPFQIGDSSSSAITRHCALASSACAFMSLTYGCIYIIRFGMMRKTYKAAEWACELPKQVFWIFWNVWIMLALPAIWLGWAMIFYMACIMSYVWIPDAMPIEDDAAFQDSVRHAGVHYLLPRIAITALLCLGLVYLVLVGFTFRRYDEPMDRAWQERVRKWMRVDGGSPENSAKQRRHNFKSVDSGATLH